MIGLIIKACLEEENILRKNIHELEKDINNKIKYYVINKLCGELPLKLFYKIIEMIDAGISHEILMNLYHLFLKISKNINLKVDINYKKNKINPKLLLEFFIYKQNNWFKLSEFEEYFGVNKKTAWVYLNSMLNKGLLMHNGKKANKARYCFINEKIIIAFNKNQFKENNILPFSI